MRRILVLLAVAAMPLAAQQPPRAGHDEQMMAHMEHMEDMMAPMMGAMAYQPDRLLAHKDSLNLTAAQIARLTSLQDAAKKAHEDCAAQLKPHLDAVGQGLSVAAPDTVALKQHFDAAHAAMGKGHWVMFSIATQGRAVLSDEQRSQVDRWSRRKSEHGAQHH